MALTLVVLAAGLGSRYGGQKALGAVGPSGETVMDYTIHDALRSGFDRVVVVVRPGEEVAFRAGVEAVRRGAVPITFAWQRFQELPAGRQTPVGRHKPWGTGHAVLSAAAHVDGPFAVANADDYYGSSSLDLLRRCLVGASDRETRICLVGYPLEQTLSPHGGVSRAVCDIDGAGWVEGLRELVDVRRDGGSIVARHGDEPVELSGDEIVSMNLWGLVPSFVPFLRGSFDRFLDRHGNDPSAEFLLPDAVSEMLAAGQVRVRAVPARDAWFGLTFADDREHAVQRVAELVERGAYPNPLFGQEIG